MNKITQLTTKESVTIQPSALFCAITLFTDNASAGQTSDVWDLTKDNCLSFANNQIQGCAYIKDGVIIIENVIAYIVFFN